MGNKLFIICPFSGLEHFLRTKYGEDVFFLTYSASILQHNDYEYITELRQFILREKIKSITFVNDISCRFIKQVIQQKQKFGLASESTLEELYIEHYFSEFKDKSILDQTYNLAKLNVMKQVQDCLQSGIIGKAIEENAIKVKGLICSKITRSIADINITDKKQHELQLTY
jgi:carbonic anhydrase